LTKLCEPGIFQEDRRDCNESAHAATGYDSDKATSDS
jgi:hypothetical protein